MKIRKRYPAIIIPLALLFGLVLTNPSQSQHFARFVHEFQIREAEHFATCPKCAGSKPSAGPDADDITSILGEQGTYYKSLFILSYVSDRGLFRAKTIGIGGIVFGPVLKSVRCPQDYRVLPLPPVKHEFHVTLRANDSLLVDGEPISEAALFKQLGELPDKSETEVILHADPKVKIVKEAKLTDQIRSLGFQVTTIFQANTVTIPEGKN